MTDGHAINDSRVTRKEAVALAKAGHDMIVVAQWTSVYFNPLLKVRDCITCSSCDRSTQPFTGKLGRVRRILLVRNLYRIVKEEAPDLVVCHEFESAVCALWIKFRLGIPFVYDVHEGYEGSIPLIFPKIIRPLISFVVKALMRLVVRGSSGITACTPGVYPYKYAKKIGRPIELIYNSPPLSSFIYSETECERIVVAHEGNVTFDRGPMELLEAIGLLKKRRSDFIVKFFGRFSPDVERVFIPRMKELGLDTCVELCGQLDFEKLGAAESQCQIGVVIGNDGYNYRLALPNKLFSYMACGMAILGPKFGEMEHVIESDKSGIAINPKSSEDIANGLEYLIAHPEERRQMARNGRKAIEEKYSWERMEEVMKEFYEKILIKGR